MEIVTVLLGLIASISVAIYAYYRRAFNHWKNLGIPYADPAFPFGNAKGMCITRPLSAVVNTIYNEYKDEKIVGFFLLFRPTLLLRDPEVIKAVCIRDFMNFHDRGVYVNEKDDPLAGHLFSIGGSKWRNIRNKLTPTFSSGKMKMMFPLFAECSRQLKDVLDPRAERGEAVDVREYAACFTTDIISLCAFGLETDCLHKPDSDFRKYGSTLLAPSFLGLLSMSIQFLVPELAELFNLRFTEKETSDFFLGTLKQNMTYREVNEVRRKDFLDLLIQLKNKGRLEDDESAITGNETKFTFEEAAAQAYAFFVAGFETSSTALMYGVYELAKQPHLQQKVRDEIRGVLKKHGNELTYEATTEMPYLGRVIDETLRKYPPGPILQRVCNRDYQIEGTKYIIPKGNHIIIDVYGLHHDAEYYPDPERFDPDRFIESEKAKRPHCSYMPFGTGPRGCVAMRFGLLQTRVGLITLLSNYSFSMLPDTPTRIEYNPKTFTLMPKDNFYLKITKA